MILWHGSKLENFMGILAEGLKIAPPTAQITGHAFGLGIYLADTFEKSWSYTSNSSNKYAYMLLCEAALGNMLELNNYEPISELESNINYSI